MHLTTRAFLVAGSTVWLAVPAMGQTIRPAQDQSSEQMQKDMAECSTTASQSTGHNPSAPPAEDERHVGGRARGATAGAAAGAVAAEIQHDDAYDRASDDVKEAHRKNQAEDAAAAAAAVGASRQRRERRADRKEDKAEEEAAGAYTKAYHSCLTGRGYEVVP
jgi:hypothetical protein